MSQVIRKMKLFIFGLLFFVMLTTTLAIFGLSNLTVEEHYRTVADEGNVQDYLRDFDCTFLHCLWYEETRDILMSAKGHEFYERIKYFMILGTVIAGALFVLFSHSLKTALRNGALPLLLLGLVVFVPFFLPTFENEYVDVNGMISLVFEPIQIVLLLMLTTGVGLMIGSYILHKDEKR